MYRQKKKKLNTSESEIILQLKEKFKNCISRSEKMTILTVLPKSWPAAKIQEKCSCSNYMVRKVKEKGILSSPQN